MKSSNYLGTDNKTSQKLILKDTSFKVIAISEDTDGIKMMRRTRLCNNISKTT
jgi:hypothetical protein